MKGELDPKTGTELTTDEKRDAASTKPHTLSHNASVYMCKITDISVPENISSIEKCKFEELKTMVVYRGVA